MKFRKIFCCFIFLQFLFFSAHSFARDTDLYTNLQSTIEPNILIIFDNSGSMADPPQPTAFCEYDPNFTYPQPSDSSVPALDPVKVYRQNTNGKWFPPLRLFKNSVSLVECWYASFYLNYYGIYTGYTDVNCSTAEYTLATGNYLRWLYADQVNKDPCRSKMDIAKEVIKGFVESIPKVRIGLMKFNFSEGGTIVNAVRGLDEKYNGPAGNNKTHRQHLLASIDALTPSTWTPLAETLYEAGLYFKGAASYFNPGVTYTTPIQYYCQKNFVIYMTDGQPTMDRNTILSTAIGDRNGDQKEPPGALNDPFKNNTMDESHYLDDVAKYLYDTDLLPDNPSIPISAGKQNVITYTIGFELDMSYDPVEAQKAKSLLQDAANHGRGKFYVAEGARGLADAFSNILNEVLAKSSSFVAPIVPVSKMERTAAGDKIYLAFFRPKQSGMWSGNIKKYGVAQTNNPGAGIVVGDILSVNGAKALDANGAFYPSSKSYWTTASFDGGEVEVGGVGEILQNRTTPRNIYTLLPGDPQDEDDGPDGDTSFDLTNAWNAFTTGNSRLTTTKLGVSTTDEKNNLINFVRGIDAYDDNTNGETTDKRDWMLGSFLHSRPHIIQYADRTVIYAGANDGMLHAFDDATGEELWGFIPPCFLPMLKYLHTDTPPIYVDGSPKSYVTYDGNGNVTKAILVFGLRRGVDKDGKGYYYALDVTNPLAPKYLWRIYKGRKGTFNDLGQTWSTPLIAKVPYGDQTTNPPGYKWVAIFGAGYDEEMDQKQPRVGDIKSGRGMYMADVLTGDYFWGRSGVGSQDPAEADMDYPVPSDVAAIDLDGDGRVDRIYVGDLAGNMWRYNIGDLNKDGYTNPAIYTPSCEWKVKKIFNPPTTKKAIFYPPDVTFEKDSTGEYEMLFFGTGDREDPKVTKDVKNKLYALKDKNLNVTLGHSDLVEVTDFYSWNQATKTAKLNEIKSKYGWYISLDSHKKDDLYGEKCLASPVVYDKIAYFTTFSPSTGSIDDPCFIGEGTATLYALNYKTGEAAFNFDLTNDVGGNIVKGKSDRSTFIGSAIPSGVVVTVIGSRVTAYIGVGGGVYRPTLSSTRSMFPVHWKLVF